MEAHSLPEPCPREQPRTVEDDIAGQPGADVGRRGRGHVRWSFLIRKARRTGGSTGRRLVLHQDVESSFPASADACRIGEFAKHKPVAHFLEPAIDLRQPLLGTGYDLAMNEENVPFERPGR